MREADGGGSSTMPQKSNPIRAEALVALARRNTALLGGLHEGMLHTHERDDAAWQLEWQLLPDMVEVAATALAHAGTLARTLVVDPGRMEANLAASLGLLLAEAATFALAAQLPRPEAQALVKAACSDVMSSGRDLPDLLAERTPAPFEWAELRRQAERPACADALIDRVLCSLHGTVRPA